MITSIVLGYAASCYLGVYISSKVTGSAVDPYYFVMAPITAPIAAYVHVRNKLSA